MIPAEILQSVTENSADMTNAMLFLTSCKLLKCQIAIDCKYHDRLSNLIREHYEENYRPQMPPSGVEGEILGGMNSEYTSTGAKEMKLGEAIKVLDNAANNPNQHTAKIAVANLNLSKQAQNRAPVRQAVNWKELCPELAKLEKTLESANPTSKVAKGQNDSANTLNRWGHPDAHTLGWMEADCVARARVGEEFARTSTQDLSRPDATALAVRKQAHDDDFVLDQGSSTGQTDRLLREQDRNTIAKAHGEAGVSLRSEYMRRDSKAEVSGPLDMGFLAVSNLDE